MNQIGGQKLSKNKPFNLSDAINDEELLDFALSYVAERNSDDDTHPISNRIIVAYIVKQFEKEGKDQFTEEEVHEEYSKMLTDYILNNLVKKDFLDVNFEEDGNVTYTVPEDIKEALKKENHI